MSGKTVFIAGGTGLIGQAVRKQLAADSTIEKVFVLSRRKLDSLHAKEQLIEFDFENWNQIQLDQTPDWVICTLGTTIKKAGSQAAFTKVDDEYVRHLADLAAKWNCSFGVISSIGATANTSNFYLRTKGEMEQYVQSLNLNQTVILRPSLLLGDREEFRLGEKVGEVLSKLLSPLLFGSLKKYKPVYDREVAHTLITKLKAALPGVDIVESDQIKALNQ